jgi:ParB-like chromosome segregation protein Spo0J
MELQWIPVDLIHPNPWNANVMDPEMFAKEMASIREFGFVDPLTVRDLGDSWFELIDGEHRWKAGKQDDIQTDADGKRSVVRPAMAYLPCIDLGTVDDAVAMQLSVVLNETRGSPNRDRLSELLRDLRERTSEVHLEAVMPFSRARLDDLLAERQERDFASLRTARVDREHPGAGWVERVFRLPSGW